MTQHPVSKISKNKLINGINDGVNGDSSRNSEPSDETIQESNNELELNITKPGHEFNDKEILDKNADA